MLNHTLLATAGSAHPAPSLPSLPLDLLEHICKMGLELEERIALTTCCCTLWAREDVACSPALWGDLYIQAPALSRRWAAHPEEWQHSLAAWLVQHRPALRRLRLSLQGMPAAAADPAAAAVLAGAAGSPLATLQLVHGGGLSSGGREGGAAGRDGFCLAASLAKLTALTRLHLGECPTSVLPSLPPLGALADLHFYTSGSGSQVVMTSEPQLAQLKSLQRLALSGCGLPACPPQLGELSQLVALNLSSNEALGVAEEAAFEPLAKLQALTCLQLGGCNLQRLPLALSSLRSLALLDLCNSPTLGREAAQGPAFAPLEHLAQSLTRLVLSSCGLVRLPPQLAALGKLALLNCCANPDLGASGEAAFEPLEDLSSLTSLDLTACGLRSLPEQLQALPQLAALEVSANRELGPGGPPALAPLEHATALTRLNVSTCNLQALPAGMSALRRLADLKLCSNRGLGQRSGEAVCALLEALPALSSLDASWCDLPRLPPQLAPLSLAWPSRCLK